MEERRRFSLLEVETGVLFGRLCYQDSVGSELVAEVALVINSR